MADENTEKNFFLAADAWVCDGYYADIRFIAGGDGRDRSIWDASIFLTPLPPPNEHGMRIDSCGILVGLIQRSRGTKKQLISLLKSAAKGVISIPSAKLIVHRDHSLYLFSEMSSRDRWSYDLHLYVGGSPRPHPAPAQLAEYDNALRAATPPFDGLADASGWLGLIAPGTDSRSSCINIRVGPPVDIVFDECSLSEDSLRVMLHAHPKFDTSHVKLSVRTVPGDGLASRRQVASEIIWGRAKNGVRAGVANVSLKNADSALAMLMIDSTTVRRQWFGDESKARNHRLIAVSRFDKDLRMIKNAALENPDSNRFEVGISALLFLLGFSPSIQVESDSPDLIVATPRGRIALVECAIKVADFATKLGKLVDRRGALVKALQASNHPNNVAAILVCRLPRDQISAQIDSLRSHKVILLTEEDIVGGFERLRFPNDPDKMLEEAEEALKPKPSGPFDREY